MTSRESIIRFLMRTQKDITQADALTLADQLLIQLADDGYLVVQRGKGHSIKPPTGSLGVEPT